MAKANTKSRKGNRTTSTTNTSSTDINTCKNCGRTEHWAKDCWRPGGGTYDSSTSNHNPQKGKDHSHKKGKGKGKHVDVMETNQPSETASTVSYPSQTPSTIGELSCNSNVEPWIMGVTINSVSTRRQAGAEFLAFLTVVHSFTHVRSSIQDKKYRCLILESTLQVELDSNMTEDDW